MSISIIAWKTIIIIIGETERKQNLWYQKQKQMGRYIENKWKLVRGAHSAKFSVSRPFTKQ